MLINVLLLLFLLILRPFSLSLSIVALLTYSAQPLLDYSLNKLRKTTDSQEKKTADSHHHYLYCDSRQINIEKYLE